MAHKTITISEEAYEALARLKHNGESFSRVILRVAHRHTAQKLLEYFESQEPAPDLAESIERVYSERSRVHLREVVLE
ncbi:MAG: antitoxin VapB family protein [Thermoplasmata archaeon]